MIPQPHDGGVGEVELEDGEVLLAAIVGERFGEVGDVAGPREDVGEEGEVVVLEGVVGRAPARQQVRLLGAEVLGVLEAEASGGRERIPLHLGPEGGEIRALGQEEFEVGRVPAWKDEERGREGRS